MVLNTRKFNYEHYTFENTTKSDWKIISSFYFGQCVTSNNIDSLKDGQFLKIYLNKSMDYKVWIHDPDFFLLTANPDIIPFAKVLMKPNGIKALWVMIRPVFYVNLDREGLLSRFLVKLLI